jgi:hypothetical protein
MGVMAGIPDIVLVSPYGSVRFLELKRAGETLSDSQENFRVHCIRQGIPHAVAFTFDQALAALDAWNCLTTLETPQRRDDAASQREMELK